MKSTIISTIIAVALIGGAYVFSTGALSSDQVGSTENVTIENGKQIITITVNGGYQPRLTDAKAGIPSVIRMVTTNTFSCAMGLKIPSLGFGQYLPPASTTDIPIPVEKAVKTIKGVCSMGMYKFQVRFN